MQHDNIQAILTVVQQIPKGQVATYGQIARIAGIPKNARQVGSVLKSHPDAKLVPWHRVVNAQGQISTRDNSNSQYQQRELLEQENIMFNDSGRVDLQRFQWRL